MGRGLFRLTARTLMLAGPIVGAVFLVAAVRDWPASSVSNWLFLAGAFVAAIGGFMFGRPFSTTPASHRGWIGLTGRQMDAHAQIFGSADRAAQEIMRDRFAVAPDGPMFLAAGVLVIAAAGGVIWLA